MNFHALGFLMIDTGVSNYIVQGTIEMPLFGYTCELVIDVNSIFIQHFYQIFIYSISLLKSYYASVAV